MSVSQKKSKKKNHSSTRSQPNRTKFTRSKLLIGISLCVIAILYLQLSYRSLRHDLIHITNPDAWMVIHQIPNTAYQFTSQGMTVETSMDAHILPPIINDSTTWEDLPYVTVQFEPASFDRELSLSWFLADNSNDFYVRTQIVKAGESHVYFNTQDELLTFKIDDWNRTFQNQGQIRKYGIQFKDNFTFKSITLSNRLEFSDHLDLILTNMFITHDRITSYSINFVKGVIVGQSRLNLWLGLFICVSAIYFTIRRSPAKLCAAIFIAFAIYDVNFNINLIRLADYGLSYSAFYRSEYDEFQSRFGREFADLNKKLREIIPFGSKVRFIPSLQYPYRGERNWVESLYAGIYDYSSPQPEYLVLHYPVDTRMGKDSAGRRVVDVSKTIYFVEELYVLSSDNIICRILEVK